MSSSAPTPSTTSIFDDSPPVAHKSPHTALIGGLVAGLASLLLLILIFSILYRTRKYGFLTSRPPSRLPISPGIKGSSSGSRSGSGTGTPNINGVGGLRTGAVTPFEPQSPLSPTGTGLDLDLEEGRKEGKEKFDEKEKGRDSSARYESGYGYGYGYYGMGQNPLSLPSSQISQHPLSVDPSRFVYPAVPVLARYKSTPAAAPAPAPTSTFPDVRTTTMNANVRDKAKTRDGGQQQSQTQSQSQSHSHMQNNRSEHLSMLSTLGEGLRPHLTVKTTTTPPIHPVLMDPRAASNVNASPPALVNDSDDEKERVTAVI